MPSSQMTMQNATRARVEVPHETFVFHGAARLLGIQLRRFLSGAADGSGVTSSIARPGFSVFNFSALLGGLGAGKKVIIF
jgi:hypothetical protein